MKIKVFLFGLYRNRAGAYNPETGIILPVEKNFLLIDLLKMFEIRADAAVIYINDVVFKTDEAGVIEDGDVIKVLPVVLGG